MGPDNVKCLMLPVKSIIFNISSDRVQAYLSK